MEKFKMRAR